MENSKEGYIFTVYGGEKYLRQAVACAQTLRRFDSVRNIALLCDETVKKIVDAQVAGGLFDLVRSLAEEHASIVGFKHNVHQYTLFERNLFLDSDMVWCRDPEPLWRSFQNYDFTITGKLVADSFFGAHKNWRIIEDILLGKRRKTLQTFGLNHLSRVQSGMIYAANQTSTAKVCLLAQKMLADKDKTHFVSRTKEHGRSLESCEWSLAMAMSKLKMPVYPWMQGQMSPQLDYLSHLVWHDANFTQVTYRFYCDDRVNELRGLRPAWLRETLIRLFGLLPGKGDFVEFTPFCLHFGWLHAKQPFLDFADRVWQNLNEKRNVAS